MKTIKNAIILFIISLFLANCEKNDTIINPKTESVINYNDYLANLQTTNVLVKKNVTDIYSKKGKLKKGKNQFSNSEYNSIIKSGFQSMEANNNELTNMVLKSPDEFKNSFKKFKIEDLSSATIDQINLPKKAILYFKKLYFLSKNKDFDGMVLLLNEFKKEKDNPDLLSLIGVFSVIELNNNKLLQARRANCGSAKTVAVAASVGAFAGAMTGAFYGSFLGPAGTALGALGGAIYGGVMTTVTSMSTMAILCASTQNVQQQQLPSELQLELDENGNPIIYTENWPDTFLGEPFIPLP